MTRLKTREPCHKGLGLKAMEERGGCWEEH